MSFGERSSNIDPAVGEHYSTLSMRAAELVKKQLQDNPASRLGLPTGRTPTSSYKLLAHWSKNADLDWSKAVCFGLDEYIDTEETYSFRRYLEQSIYRYTNLPITSRFNPLFIDDYDNLIRKYGGLDLTLLGIGKNGHIAFNEPGTPLNSWTHSILLTESTRIANQEFFGNLEHTPTQAVTMGIRTILSSKRIVLMVSGKQKRSILETALKGPITPAVPASFLQLHDSLTVLTDFD